MLQRGQALVETAFFLPLMLLAMISIIYFSQYGVLQGRAVLAVRYASLVSNGAAANAKNALSLEGMYAEMSREGAGAAPSPPAFVDSCANGTAASDTSKALTLTQNAYVSGSTPAPAPKYFAPNTAATSLCTPVQVQLPGASATLEGDYGDFQLTVLVTSVSATKTIPGMLKAMTNLSVSPAVSAVDGYPEPPTAARLLYCSQNFTENLATGLGQAQPAPSAGSKYNVPTPVPSGNSYPTMRPGC